MAERSTPLSTCKFASHQRGEIYSLAHTPDRFKQRWLPTLLQYRTQSACLANSRRVNIYVWTKLPKWSSLYCSMFAPARLLQHLVPGRQLRKCDSKIADLHGDLVKALRAKRFDEALDLYELMEKRKPDEPRWAHRKGDLLRRLGRDADAVVAYERAVRLYSARGFDARATATAKLLLTIDPSKGEVLERAHTRTTTFPRACPPSI